MRMQICGDVQVREHRGYRGTLRAGADIPLQFDDDGSVTVQDTYLEHWFRCDACGEYIDIDDTFDKVFFD